MSIPLNFKKASSYSAAKTPYSTQSTFYTQPQNTPRQLEGRGITSSLIGSSYVTRESKLKEVHQKYEKEAQAINNNYIQHYQHQLEIGKTIVQTEDALDHAKRRSSALEVRLDDCFREIDQHKRQKLELARETAELREEVRRKDRLLEDREHKLTNTQHNATSVNFENEGFRHEMKRLSDTYNQKLKEVEEKYKNEISEFTEEIDRLRSQIKEQDINTEAKVRGISRDLEAKVRSLENQLREKDRIINESAHEFRSLKEYNVKVKMEFEEELRRQVIIIRDKERASYETSTKDMENRVKELELEKETVEKKIPELTQDIKNRDKMLKELKLKAEDQIRGLKKGNIDLNDHISEMGTEIERLQRELTGRDSKIAKLHDEIKHLNLELGYQKDKFLPEIDRLIAKNDADIKRFQEYERKLKSRIVELEGMIKASDAESVRLRHDVERMKQQITGNIHKSIAEVFVDYGTSNMDAKSMF